MRYFMLARRAGVPAAAAAAIGLLSATPALADVTVSPTSAAQGSGANLTLHVTNTGTQPVGTITLRLPADTPIAEVYPLSVDNWAPRIEPLTLKTPLTTIHGGTPVTETAGAITWIAMPGKALAPGKAADVAVAVGPLPTVGSMKLAVTTTYTDGKAGPVMPPASLTLTPAAPGQAAPTHHGGDATGTTGGTAEDDFFQNAIAEAERGPSFWAVAGWVVAGLVIIAGAVMMLRARHRRAEDDEEPDEDGKPDETAQAQEEPKEPVAAGGSKWSFRG